MIPIGLYLMARSLLINYMPATNYEEWALRDIYLNIPRIFAAFLGYKIAKTFWTQNQLGIYLRNWQWPLLAFFFHAVILLMDRVSRSPIYFQSNYLAELSFGSFLVGLNEDILFLGLLLNALKDRFGTKRAVWLTALFHTLFHIGYVETIYLAPIFIITLASAIIRASGGSLIWLALSHAIYDILALFINAKQPAEPSVKFWTIWIAVAIILPMYLWRRSNRQSIWL